MGIGHFRPKIATEPPSRIAGQPKPVGVGAEWCWVSKVEPRITATRSELLSFIGLAEESPEGDLVSDPLKAIEDQDGYEGDKRQKGQFDRTCQDRWKTKRDAKEKGNAPVFGEDL